jgi:GMP synthase (glutamine-hydrolysing)
MLKTVVAIRHIAFEDLGFFAAPLAQAGHAIRYCEAAGDDLSALDPIAPELLIVLGGPMGVHEADRHPFMATELRLIERRIAAGRPILGICLGAQMIAHVLGARVYPGPTKEIGFAPVRLTADGQGSPLGVLPEGQPVLHWHGDTFDLPAGAMLLASTDAYANQAFSAGPNVLGLQFHLEAGRGIERWLTGHADEISAVGIDPEALRRGADRHAAALESVSADMLTAWLHALPA